jgi:hypothetical protein
MLRGVADQIHHRPLEGVTAQRGEELMVRRVEDHRAVGIAGVGGVDLLEQREYMRTAPD